MRGRTLLGIRHCHDAADSRPRTVLFRLHWALGLTAGFVLALMA